MDTPTMLTCIASAITTIGFVYGFLRNFRADINSHLDRLDKRMDRLEQRMDIFEKKLISIEERMFWMATGKRIEDVILEEKLKQKTDP